MVCKNRGYIWVLGSIVPPRNNGYITSLTNWERGDRDSLRSVNSPPNSNRPMNFLFLSIVINSINRRCQKPIKIPTTRSLRSTARQIMCMLEGRGTPLSGDGCNVAAVSVPVHDAAAVAELERPHHLEQVGLPMGESDERRGGRERVRARESETHTGIHVGKRTERNTYC